MARQEDIFRVQAVIGKLSLPVLILWTIWKINLFLYFVDILCWYVVAQHLELFIVQLYELNNRVTKLLSHVVVFNFFHSIVNYMFMTTHWIIDSVPSLGVYYFLSLTLSVCISICPSVTLLLQIASSFLFVDGIEPFFGRQFSMWHSTKLRFLI